MRYYIVTEHNPDGGATVETHIVAAKNPAAALKAIVEPRFKAEVAKNTEIVALMQKGVEVITAK